MEKKLQRDTKKEAKGKSLGAVKMLNHIGGGKEKHIKFCVKDTAK